MQAEQTQDMEGRTKMEREQKLQNEIMGILPERIRGLVHACALAFDRLQEIRLRVHAPLIFQYDGTEYFADREFGRTKEERRAYIVEEQDIADTLALVSEYSIYAYEDEIRQGFITVQGGHRVGLAGMTVMEQGKVKYVKHISFLNIRVAHEQKGCADVVMPYVRSEDSVYHTLIISPPCGGKTTLLRDMIRSLSDGDPTHTGLTVGVVDERSELAACYRGIPQNDLGIRTDVLDCCPKADGMLMLLRSMAPRMIAVDEIGSAKDIDALEYVMNCGCKLLATVHGSSIEDIKNKPVLRRLVEERMFERYIILGGGRQPGQIQYIFDGMGNCLYGNCTPRVRCVNAGG